jgi:hypothetical protein
MLNWFKALFKKPEVKNRDVRQDYEFVAVAPSSNNEVILLVKVQDVEVRFVGSGSVWYRLPEFQRCPTSQETKLSEIWSRLRHEKRI